jgi:thiol-disulfide isomerase/thioredoxin
MKKSTLLLFVTSLFTLLQCTRPKGQLVEFHFSPNQPTTIFIEVPPLHYKYAPKQIDTLYPRTDKNLFFVNTKELPRVVMVSINEGSFPLYLDGKSNLNVTIHRGNPDSLFSIEGYPNGLQDLFYELKKSEKSKQEALLRDKPKFVKGENSAYLRILDDIQSNRKSVLMGTPLEFMYWSAIGDWLVARLEWMNRAKMPLNKRDEVRKSVMQVARAADFFSLKSLESQRAGIRDFTNAWAHSFGIADSVRKIYGQETSIYDVNRLAYNALNARRLEVIRFVEEDKAQAFAEMYLAAERIGEAPFEEATRSMIQFVQKWTDSYPEYTDFITRFYNQMKRVQPGEPAINFAFPNAQSDTVRLSDFKGKYVFLDFWASWCSPCLEEFPDMAELYNQLDTSQIEFVGIGLDQEFETWKASIQRYPMPWIQLYGGREFENPLFKAYRGGGIPLVVLIGPDGKILRFDDVKASLNLHEVLKSYGLTVKPIR